MANPGGRTVTAYVYARSIAEIADSKLAQSVDVHIFCLSGSSQSCEKHLLGRNVCSSVCPHGTTRSHWKDFHEKWRLSISRKYVQIIQDLLKSDKKEVYFNEYLCIFITIFRRILIRMRNISGKSCREYQGTFLIQQVFLENRVVYEIMWKNVVESDRSPISV
jgi:hypothetical protein